jgi:hypothetical protein
MTLWKIGLQVLRWMRVKLTLSTLTCGLCFSAVCLLVQGKKCSDVQKNEACLYTPVTTGATYKQEDGTS